MNGAGVISKSFWRVIEFGTLLVISFALSACISNVSAATPNASPTPTGTIVIKITNPNVDAAIARVRETQEVAVLDGDILALQSCFRGQHVSVWVRDFYVKTFLCDDRVPPEYLITLDPLPAVDNPNYFWNSALNCSGCHSDPSAGLNEYQEWQIDGHSKVFVNSFFWSMYMGANQNLATPNGPGFRLDYPQENGNCAFCHAPAAITLLQQGVDLSVWNNQLPGGQINTETEGITCDVCHKAVDVLMGEDGRPNPNRPGVLSLALARPISGDVFSIGPWPDRKFGDSENNGGVNHLSACSPIFGEGKFCAACHYGKFFGTVIYDSYGEWLGSVYSQKQINGLDNANYRSCQDCHMQPAQPIGGSSWAARDACSSANSSFRDFSHNMMKRDSTNNPILIQQAADVRINTQIDKGRLRVTVTVVNTRAGHKLPTDSPLRHLILVIEAKDRNGRSLAQVDGPVIPEWGGTGGGPYDYAGKPGVIYANLLKNKSTNALPANDYWNPAIAGWEVSDTRLSPFVEVPSDYYFVMPSKGPATITAQLFYRYAYIDLIRQKGWPVNDILVNWAQAKYPEQ